MATLYPLQTSGIRDDLNGNFFAQAIRQALWTAAADPFGDFVDIRENMPGAYTAPILNKQDAVYTR